MGGSFTSGSSLEGRISKRLELEFSKIRAENAEKQLEIKELTERNKRHIEFETAIIPTLIDTQLARRRVAIIQTGDYSAATQCAKSILEAAGARVVSMTTLNDLQSPSAQAHAARALRKITGVTNTQDAVPSVLGIVANAIANGSSDGSLDVLENEGLLLKSGEYNRGVLNIVVVGGCKVEDSAERVQKTDLALIGKLKDAGVLLVAGVEPANTGYSCMSDYHSKDIPTVDDIDEPIGQVALVYVVKGESGRFGVKESSDRVVPVYLESNEWLSRFRR